MAREGQDPPLREWERYERNAGDGVPTGAGEVRTERRGRRSLLYTLVGTPIGRPEIRRISSPQGDPYGFSEEDHMEIAPQGYFLALRASQGHALYGSAVEGRRTANGRPYGCGGGPSRRVSPYREPREGDDFVISLYGA